MFAHTPQLADLPAHLRPRMFAHTPQLADLPAHLRPRMLAFGSLADGFLPFPKPPHSHAATQQGSMGLLQLEQDKQGHSHQHAEYPNSAVAVGISLGSIVMKAVQGYVCGRHSSQVKGWQAAQGRRGSSHAQSHVHDCSPTCMTAVPRA